MKMQGGIPMKCTVMIDKNLNEEVILYAREETETVLQ